MAKKKICFFIGDISGAGGTERVTKIIAGGLAENYEISILALYNHCNISIDFADLHVLNAKKGNRSFFKIAKNIRNYVSSRNIDVLINVDSILMAFSVFALIGVTCKNVCWEHFNYKTNAFSNFRPIARRLAKLFGDRIIVLTERDRLYWNNGKVVVIPNPSPFQFPEVNLNNRKNKIIAVGRYSHQKGLDRLLQIWEIVQKKNIDNSFELDIIGQGELKENLQKTIDERGIKNVFLSPYTNNVEEVYRESHIYVMTSHFEGLPMVLIEALSFGIPIVSFDIDCGPSDIITNGENGFLIPNGDLSAFAEKLSFLMCNRNEVLRMSKNCLEKRENYGNKAIMDCWTSFLKEL